MRNKTEAVITSVWIFALSYKLFGLLPATILALATLIPLWISNGLSTSGAPILFFGIGTVAACVLAFVYGVIYTHLWVILPVILIAIALTSQHGNTFFAFSGQVIVVAVLFSVNGDGDLIKIAILTTWMVALLQGIQLIVTGIYGALFDR